MGSLSSSCISLRAPVCEIQPCFTIFVVQFVNDSYVWLQYCLEWNLLLENFPVFVVCPNVHDTFYNNCIRRMYRYIAHAESNSRLGVKGV
jgi:hypothetical protein